MVLHVHCKKCGYFWESSVVPCECVYCHSRKLNLIDKKTYDNWKSVNKYSLKYVEREYPSVILNCDTVFHNCLVHGDFDSLPWADGLKFYFLERGRNAD